MNRLPAILIFLLSAVICVAAQNSSYADAQKAEPNPQNPATSQANTGQTSAASPQAPPANSGAATLAQPSTADDAGLQGRIQQALSNEPSLGGSHISVNVTAGAIELSGTAASGNDRQTAERIAQSFDGNRKLEDKLVITGQAPAAHNPQQK